MDGQTATLLLFLTTFLLLGVLGIFGWRRREPAAPPATPTLPDAETASPAVTFPVILVLDAANRVVEANEAGRRFSTLEEDTLTGRPISEVLAHYPELLARMLPAGAVDDHVPIERDGQRELYHLRLVVLPNGQGRVLLLHHADPNQQPAAAPAGQDRPPFQFELVARVSHEMRSPLNAILGYAEILHNGLLGPLSEAQRNAMSQVIDRAKHLTLLVRDLMDGAQMESGSFTLQEKAVDVAELFERIEETMRFAAAEKELDLTLYISPDMPPTIWGDSARLYQIVCNLLDNALKFTEKGGVCVAVNRPDPDTWTIEVTDTGIGIPAGVQQTIFTPFFRAPNAATHKGIGLGLSIAYQLVQQMKGHMALQSTEGQGTVFTVTLPLRREAVPQ